METLGICELEQSNILQTITELLTEVKSVKQSLVLLTEKVDGLTGCKCKESGIVLEDAVVRDDVKPTSTKYESMNQERKSGYDSIDGKPGIDTDANVQRNLMQTNAEDKEPVRNENPRSPYTDKKRRRRLTNDTEADCLGKALQENIVILVEDMQFSSSGLGDLLISNDCLTGDECTALYALNPKDQIRNTVRLIKGRSFEVLKKFLNCVKKFHPEIAAKIWKSYEEKKKSHVGERLCVFCKLKRAIDVRYVADFVWSVDGISDDVYAEIVSHTNYNMSDETKWEKLAEACNKSDNTKILKTIINALERKGYYSHIIPWLRRESKLACRCSDMKDLKVDFNIPFEVTDDDHSTLSPLSSIEDEDFPNFANGHDICSSENSIDIDEESRYNAIRVHVSRILSDAGNCLVLTDFTNENVPQNYRARSHSFGKKKKSLQHIFGGAQRRASCFS